MKAGQNLRKSNGRMAASLTAAPAIDVSRDHA